MTDGDDIYVMTSDQAILKSVLKRGQLAFSVILLGKIIQAADEAIRLYDTASKKAATG